MGWNNILLETEGNTAVITINRPKALNALNSETLQELSRAIDKVAGDPAVAVAIVTGAGEKAFVAGADISQMKEMTPLEAREFARLGQEVFDKIENLAKPVIAAVNGFALGGGCELSMACDIRIAADNARFGQPEVGLGITAGFAGTQRLPRLVGKGVASEILMTGDVISAEEAYRIGLANKVVPAADLMKVARDLASRIASKGRVAVRLTKSAIHQGLNMDIERGQAFEADAFALCFASADQKEGMDAFLNKRKPNFTGK